MLILPFLLLFLYLFILWPSVPQLWTYDSPNSFYRFLVYVARFLFQIVRLFYYGLFPRCGTHCWIMLFHLQFSIDNYCSFTSGFLWFFLCSCLSFCSLPLFPALPFPWFFVVLLFCLLYYTNYSLLRLIYQVSTSGYHICKYVMPDSMHWSKTLSSRFVSFLDYERFSLFKSCPS